MAADDDLPMIAALRSAIAGSGMGITELARRSGVSHSQISRFMAGKTITAITAARLMDFFGMAVGSPQVPATEPPPLPRPVSKRK
jgi:transcriptional regulator with XRE-family HTH domain